MAKESDRPANEADDNIDAKYVMSPWPLSDQVAAERQFSSITEIGYRFANEHGD